MFHRSERLLLRPVWPEDWQALLAGIADEAVVRNLARAPWPYQEKDAREFAARPVDPLHPRFLITRASDAAAVGCIGFGPMGDAANDPGPCELGYWIARPHWGQGYATEAGRAVLAIAAMLGHRELVGSHFLDNPASGKVLRKLGFEPTGRTVDRWSCARGSHAPTAQYRRLLGSAADGQQRAA
ncbi:GNAT family N-acetyltransferase [Erythrobacter sp. WG]|uniref:GNAT family N-acetyltransferase n=1 Tax=Erythrobacter sp. WG TaxID=2985510 RepID=UPI00226DC508|nr:GNAT family N-acetyltransferase [Erythrobacter sp. WG]MCX9148842.1 GNAT family N-acetyltransferase [Erythrobacter sp. WG]